MEEEQQLLQYENKPQVAISDSTGIKYNRSFTVLNHKGWSKKLPQRPPSSTTALRPQTLQPAICNLLITA